MEKIVGALNSASFLLSACSDEKFKIFMRQVHVLSNHLVRRGTDDPDVIIAAIYYTVICNTHHTIADLKPCTSDKTREILNELWCDPKLSPSELFEKLLSVSATLSSEASLILGSVITLMLCDLRARVPIFKFSMDQHIADYSLADVFDWCQKMSSRLTITNKEAKEMLSRMLSEKLVYSYIDRDQDKVDLSTKLSEYYEKI